MLLEAPGAVRLALLLILLNAGHLASCLPLHGSNGMSTGLDHANGSPSSIKSDLKPSHYFFARSANGRDWAASVTRLVARAVPTAIMKDTKAGSRRAGRPQRHRPIDTVTSNNNRLTTRAVPTAILKSTKANPRRASKPKKHPNDVPIISEKALARTPKDYFTPKSYLVLSANETEESPEPLNYLQRGTTALRQLKHTLDDDRPELNLRKWNKSYETKASNIAITEVDAASGQLEAIFDDVFLKKLSVQQEWTKMTTVNRSSDENVAVQYANYYQNAILNDARLGSTLASTASSDEEETLAWAAITRKTLRKVFGATALQDLEYIIQRNIRSPEARQMMYDAHYANGFSQKERGIFAPSKNRAQDEAFRTFCGHAELGHSAVEMLRYFHSDFGDQVVKFIMTWPEKDTAIFIMAPQNKPPDNGR